ncbi:uncharacterized protein LOC135686644 isoform X1 [Rhopilema esculentum]|uniref:uncharacterized protein LOC135686644 isoform X1 n=1 Tax=Rhopilema esculentum TaxID=499914 RepID=UPI0031DA2D6A
MLGWKERRILQLEITESLLQDGDLLETQYPRPRLQSINKMREKLDKMSNDSDRSEGEPPVPIITNSNNTRNGKSQSETNNVSINEDHKRRDSVFKDPVKRTASLPNESKRQATHRKLSRPGFLHKTSALDKNVLWEEPRPRTKEEAEDQQRRISLVIYGSYRKDSIKNRKKIVQPLDRFRKAISQVKVLNAIKRAAEIQRKTYHQNTSSFAMIQQELDESKQFCNSDGLLFDPNFYKAQKEVHLSLEAICILSINPNARTEDQLNSVISMVKASVPAFGEYPSRMQRQLLSVGWYEKFEPNRVIIRQGHRALNFYFILSGSAIVSLTTKDKVTGASKDTTVAILSKGHSFGELALLHDTARTATVICQSEVALLAVSRQDFIDIFLRSTDDDEEQEHIRFLKSVSFLKRFPLEECNGKIGTCLCHYFRRGVVIEKDPMNSEWIYIVKSGSCRVLTRLAKPRTDPAYHLSRKLPKLKEEEILRSNRIRRKKYSNEQLSPTENNSFLLPNINPLERLRPRTHSGPSRNSKLPPVLTSEERKNAFDDMALKKPKQELYTSRLEVNKEKRGTYIYTSKSETDLKKGEEMHRQNLMKLAETHRKELENRSNKKSDKNGSTQDVFVQTEVLKPKDQFGLAALLYHDVPQTKSYLISNGAECVLLSKAWVKQKINEGLLRMLRSEISPTPCATSLQQNLQDQASWENYKSNVINGIVATRI